MFVWYFRAEMIAFVIEKRNMLEKLHNWENQSISVRILTWLILIRNSNVIQLQRSYTIFFMKNVMKIPVGTTIHFVSKKTVKLIYRLTCSIQFIVFLCIWLNKQGFGPRDGKWLVTVAYLQQQGCITDVQNVQANLQRLI